MSFLILIVNLNVKKNLTLMTLEGFNFLLISFLDSKHIDDIEVAILSKQIDVFISYRRSTGNQLASLIKVLLQLRGYKVIFILYFYIFFRYLLTWINYMLENSIHIY